MKIELHVIQENLEAVKEKAEILRSTLLAVYVAQEVNVYDGVMYAEAIHGAVHTAEEMVETLRQMAKGLSEEETLSNAAETRKKEAFSESP